MANEFIIKNGYRSQGNSEVTGSLNVTAGITGSLLGTATFATTANDATSISSAITNNTDNQVLTATGTGTINGEANLTFNGSTLTLSGPLSQSVGGLANGTFSQAHGSNVISAGAYSHAEGSGSATFTNILYSANSISSGVIVMNTDLTTVFQPGNRLYYNSDVYPDNTTFIVSSSVWNGSTTTITLTNTSITDAKFVFGSLDYPYLSWGGSGQSQATAGHAEGFYTNAIADFSHAEGQQTQTFGQYSHAEGRVSQAIGAASHAEGNGTKAIGNYSHTEGRTTQAIGASSHAEGNGTIASGSYSHAEGEGAQATGYASHAEGNSTIASGSYSHAEGYNTQAIGDNSHAEGSSTQATGNHSHAEGINTQAIGNYSHVEGYGTIATSLGSHAEGRNTITNGSYSHAEGNGASTYGPYSHAEGSSATTYGNFSHAEGSSTRTGTGTAYLAISVVNGLFTLSSSYGDQTGVLYAGERVAFDDSAYLGNYGYAYSWIISSSAYDGIDTTTVQLLDTTINTDSASIANILGGNSGDQLLAGYVAHAEGEDTTAFGYISHAEGSSTYALGGSSHAEGSSTQAIGASSHAEGSSTQAFGDQSHAEGESTIAYAPSSHAEGKSTIAGWRAYGTSTLITNGVFELETKYGDLTADFAAGQFVLINDDSGEINGTASVYKFEIASSTYNATPATEITLVDTSINTTATYPVVGLYGNDNPLYADAAIGDGQHAQGVRTKAIGVGSNAAGYETFALGWYQSVVGQYNEPVSTPNAFIVGDGDASTRHNLLVAASGSVTISGSLQIVSGSITMPNRPAFRITGNGGGTTATSYLSGSKTTIDYNQGGHYNNTTGIFTAPISGLYQVNVVIRANSNSLGTISQLIVYKNNTTLSPGPDGVVQVMVEYHSNTSMNHAGGSTISYLEAGDTLRMVVAVGELSFDGNDNFSVAYIG